MSIYGKDKDYEELVKENITKAKLLYGLTETQKSEIIKLLNKKEVIKSKNGLFANLQLKNIDKKINKITKKPLL